jgi:hypothetical protein
MPDETFNDQTRASVQVLQYLGPLPTKLSRTVHLDYAPQQIDFNPNKVYMASQFTAIRRDLFYIKPSRIAKLAEFSRKTGSGGTAESFKCKCARGDSCPGCLLFPSAAFLDPQEWFDHVSILPALSSLSVRIIILVNPHSTRTPKVCATVIHRNGCYSESSGESVDCSCYRSKRVSLRVSVCRGFV